MMKENHNKTNRVMQVISGFDLMTRLGKVHWVCAFGVVFVGGLTPHAFPDVRFGVPELEAKSNCHDRRGLCHQGFSNATLTITWMAVTNCRYDKETKPDVVVELLPRSGANTSAWIPNAGALAKCVDHGTKAPSRALDPTSLKPINSNP